MAEWRERDIIQVHNEIIEVGGGWHITPTSGLPVT